MNPNDLPVQANQINANLVDFKVLILSRYCGQFQPADEKTVTVRKSSQDIVMDLRPMAEFTTNEVSNYMAMNGYSIGFDGEAPAWLMKTDPAMELPEH